MNRIVCLLACVIAVLGSPWAAAQSESSEVSASATATGVPIERLVAGVAHKTGKKFLLDPRVHANVVLIGIEPGEVGYPELLGILTTYGFAAVEDGRLVRIIPDANLRAQVTPIITPKDSRLPDEFVTEVITLRNVSAAQLIPILRPMVNQYGHMAAVPDTNMMLVSDRFANVKRIEAVVRAFDEAEPAKPRSGSTGK
ncbi:MAG: hypothetical protein JSS29_15350 [Proteobacteria bacterium]|nr:hypothetical protein [Pseudomonadota bacterium]